MLLNFKKSIFIILFGIILTTCYGRKLKFFDPHRYSPSNNGADSTPTIVYNWTTALTDKIFPVDHFGYTNSDKFALKYLYNSNNYKTGGPIFFYAGNEGSIEGFASNTGIMWDLAAHFNAFIVFAEHRYYGETMPYGNQSYSDIKKLGYLTSAQALADYAQFLPWFKSKFNLTIDTPVIVFGGSYGGMLATWFRLKYPALTLGAWASSAPVTFFRGGNVDVGGFDKVVAQTFNASGCDYSMLMASFQTITSLGGSADGMKKLNDIFKMDPKTQIKSATDVTNLKLHLQIALEYMAMTDYPYPTSFLNPMPAWPVKSGCNAFMAIVKPTDNTTLLQGLLAISNIYYNFTGQALTTCLDPSQCGSDPNGGLDSNGYDGWDFQECTEIIIAMCSLGPPNDFFDKDCDNNTFLDFQYNLCNGIYKKIGWNKDFLNIDGVKNLYGWDFTKASNIIFTNGNLDPWSSGGVNANTPGITGGEKNGIYSFVVADSAHHLDLRQPSDCDPPSVINVRWQVVQIMECWINPNLTKCPFQISQPPNYSNMTISNNCNYTQNGYPWGQTNNVVTTIGAPNTGSTTADASGLSISPSSIDSTTSSITTSTTSAATSFITSFGVNGASMILLIISFILVKNFF